MSYQAQIGDIIKPDHWQGGATKLLPGKAYVDKDFVGSDFACESFRLVDVMYCVNVKITGSQHYARDHHKTYKSRCKIEFVRDGEPNVFSGAWLYHN